MNLRCLTCLDVGSTENAEFLTLCSVLSMARSTQCIHCLRELEYPLELGTMLGTKWAVDIAEKNILHHMTQFQMKVRVAQHTSGFLVRFLCLQRLLAPVMPSILMSCLGFCKCRATMAVLSFVRQATNWQRIESICHLDCTLLARLEFLMIGSFSKVALTEDRQWYQPSAVCWALSGLRCVHIAFLGWSGA